MTTMMFGGEEALAGRGACLQPNDTEAAANTGIRMMEDRRIFDILSGLSRIFIASSGRAGYCR